MAGDPSKGHCERPEVAGLCRRDLSGNERRPGLEVGLSLLHIIDALNRLIVAITGIFACSILSAHA